MCLSATARCRHHDMTIGYQQHMQTGNSGLVEGPAFLIHVDLLCAAGFYDIDHGAPP